MVEAGLARSGGDAAVAIDTVLDHALANQQDVGDVTASVKALDRALHRRQKVEEDQVAATLKEFRANHTESYKTDVMEQTSAFRDTQQSFVASPGPMAGVKTLTHDSHALGSSAAELVEYCRTAPGRQKNLMKAARASWNHYHREIAGDADRAESSEEEPEELRHGACWQLGSCVCGVEGGQAWQMRNRFLRNMKLAMPKRTQMQRREALKCSRVVVHLTPSVQTTGDADDAAELAEFWGLDADDRYWHISDMSFSPYEPMIQMASECNEEDQAAAARGAGELALKVC